MGNIPFKNRSSEFAGDFQRWLAENGEDNGEQLNRLRRNLRQARERELTPRQRQVLQLYFDESRSMADIARELCLNPSTVSRTLHRAKARLYRCLRYGL